MRHDQQETEDDDEDEDAPPLDDGVNEALLHKANTFIPLAEKAYMTLFPLGYDFPGSTPSIDLFTLTSWIPERIQLDSPNFRREQTWRRLVEAANRKTCLIALGTGANASNGLAPLHAYGVSRFEEKDGKRRVRVENPWQRSVQPTTLPVGPLNSGTSSASGSRRRRGSKRDRRQKGWTADLRSTLVEEEETPRECPSPRLVVGMIK